MSELTVDSIDYIPVAAEKILNKHPDSKVFGFYGDLGTGKTTLIKSICEKIGVRDIINSPTFSLINEYHYNNNEEIFHFDFYRINNLKEALDLGIEEYFFSGSYCFIEWPDLIENFLPEGFVRVTITSTGENSRLICY